MVRHPQESVQYLSKRLNPPSFPAARVRKWIADLDSDQFEKRRCATRELEKLGESVEAPLHAVLANRPSLELHHRVTALLERMESPPSPALLQHMRAVEVLEQIGTKEALALLAEIAARPEPTRLTRQARQAHERLARRLGR
jgi:hypothetical protein